MRQAHGRRRAGIGALRLLAGLALLPALLFLAAGCAAQPVSSSLPADSFVAPGFSVPPAQPLPQREDWQVLCLLGALDSDKHIELARGVQDGFACLGITVQMDDSQAEALWQGEPLPEDLPDSYDALLCLQLQPGGEDPALSAADAAAIAIPPVWPADDAVLYPLAGEENCDWYQTGQALADAVHVGLQGGEMPDEVRVSALEDSTA